MSTQLQSQIDRLHRRIRMILAPALIQTTDDTGSLLKGQIKINGTPEVIDPIGIMYAYGFHANPLPNTDATALFLSGDRSNPIIVATNHQQSRPRNYKPGEIGIYTDEGDTVTLNRENKLNITSKDRVTVKGTNKVALDTPLTEISKDVKAHGKIDASEGFFKNGVAIGGGSAGPPGPQGPAGPPGATGPAGTYQAGYGIDINTGTAPPTISTAVPYLPLTGGTIYGQLIIANAIDSSGGQWAMYNTAAGATNPAKYFRLSTVGTLELINNAYSAVIFQFSDTGNLTLGGTYLYGANATGTVDSTGGPFIYFDSNYIIAHLGPGNLSFLVQNTSGGNVGGFASDGWLLSLGSRRAIFNDGNYTQIKDGSDRTALQLGGTIDQQNYYRNGAHVFQGVNGANYECGIDLAGITLQNASAFRGRKTDNTIINLAYVYTDNSIHIASDAALQVYIGYGGGFFDSSGGFWAANNIVLKNNLFLYARNTAGTPYQLIGVNGSNQLIINPGNLDVNAGGVWNFGSINASQITALGSSATLVFADRAGAASGAWSLYATGGTARLWNAGSGDRISVDTTGSLTLAGSYLYAAGATGTVNAGGGPFIYFDSGSIVAHLGAGNQSFLVQNSAGTNIGGFNKDGWALGGVSARRLIANDGNYTAITDGSLRTALLCGGTVDQQNYYRNLTHRFQGVDGSGEWMVVNAGAVSTSVTVSAPVFAVSSTNYWIGTGGNLLYLNFNSNCYLAYDTLAGNLQYVVNGAECFMYRYGSDSLFYNSRAPMAGVGDYVNISDRRAKERIEPTTKGLDVVLQLTPVSFVRVPPPALRGTAVPNLPPRRREIGFIAQDLVEVLPEAVTVAGIPLPDGRGGLDDAEPSLGITSDTIVAVLVNAVQELHARLAVVEARA